MRHKDFIFVKNLAVKAVAGKDAWQRRIAQPLQLSLRINVGHRLKMMGSTDDLRRTLNYDSLSSGIVSEIESSSEVCSSGIEEIARRVAANITAHTAPHEWVTVVAKQPRAHLRASSKEVEVTTEPATESRVVEKVNSLSIASIIGINDLERVHKQNIVLDIEVVRGPNMDTFTQEFLDSLIAFVEGSSSLTLESFANAVADFVCSQSIHEVKVSAQKPSALNLAEAACIEVVRRPQDAQLQLALRPAATGEHCVYIAFGTNEGDCVANIREAVRALSERGVIVERTSSIYKSEPMYYTDQSQFLNGVFRCHTKISPNELLTVLKDIEYGLFERVKKFENGPRTMDLDIILFDNILLETESLTVPHKDFLNRSFVLLPLHDVMPNCPFPIISGGETTVVPVFGGRELLFDQRDLKLPTQIMAIMNATPDSFSDGGDLKHESEELLSRKACEHVENGASLLDVGGYSTRPGAACVSEDEELRRVVGTISTLRKHEKNVAISVDTFRSSVAEAALAAGANIINDVSSGVMDPRILAVAAASGAPIVLGHARGTPANMKTLTEYKTGVIHGVATELRARVDAALDAGCRSWQLLLDPGLGFAKTPSQDIEIVRRFGELKHSKVLTNGLPLLPWVVGPSRKSFIGSIAKEAQPKQRVPGTIAAVTAFVQQGADIVRVHDSKEVAQAIRVADEIYRS